MKKSFRLLSVLLALVFTLSVLASCGFSPEAKASATVDKTFSVLQSDDVLEIKEKLALEDNEAFSSDEFSDELVLLLFENFDYKINSTEVIDDSNVKVNVSITNTDMSVVIADFVAEITAYALENLQEISDMSEEEMQEKTFEILEECMNQEDLDTVTVDVDVHVTCTDGVWEVNPEETVLDAILGGFISASEDLDM